MPLNRRALSVNAAGELVGEDLTTDLDKRIVKGYLCIWGQRNLYGEKFVKGAFAKSIREHGPGSNANYQIKFLNQHNPNQALARFAVLEEDDIGLYFETMPLDNVSWADDVLTQIASGTLNNFSLGFNYVWDKLAYDDTDDSLVLIEAILLEGSVVTIPADMETYAVRSAFAQPDTLDGNIEDFITKIPRRFQMEARHLFTRQKSLINDEEPHQQRRNALQTPNEPVAHPGLDYDYILKNLKL
jgi:uncharacterized protein